MHFYKTLLWFLRWTSGMILDLTRKWQFSEKKQVRMYYGSGTVELPAVCPGGRCVCTRQIAALFCVKCHCDRHLERVTSNRKSDFVNRCIFYMRNIPVKFHPDPICNHAALGFFEDDHPNKKKKNNNKMNSDMGSVPDSAVIRLYIRYWHCRTLWRHSSTVLCHAVSRDARTPPANLVTG